MKTNKGTGVQPPHQAVRRFITIRQLAWKCSTLVITAGILFSAQSHAANGSIDTSFAPTFDGAVNAVAVSPYTGKIIAAGNFSTVNGVSRPFIASLNLDGTLDTNFVANPALTQFVSSFAIQSDGKIVVAEYKIKSPYLPSTVLRLQSSGTVDSGFTAISFNDLVKSVSLQSDGSILVGGDYTTNASVSRSYIARFSSSGSLDTSFFPNPNGSVNSVDATGSGVILIGGEFTTVAGGSHAYYAALNPSGSYYSQYFNSPDANSDVNTVFYVSGTEHFTGGVFTTIDGSSRVKVAKFDNNGNVGALGSNTPQLPTSTGWVVSMAGNNAALYAAGGFGFSYMSVPYTNIVRYAFDNQDLSFSVGSMNGGISAVCLQPSDGKILIGGSFTNVQGYARYRLARLDP